MTFSEKVKKEDLRVLAEGIEEIVLPEYKVIDLQKLITGSKDYFDEFIKLILETIINERCERERKEEREKELELEKLKIECTRKCNRIEIEIRNKRLNLRKLMKKFEMKEGCISYYLELLERQAQRAFAKKGDYVAHSSVLIPYEITQFIAHELE